MSGKVRYALTLFGAMVLTGHASAEEANSSPIAATAPAASVAPALPAVEVPTLRMQENPPILPAQSVPSTEPAGGQNTASIAPMAILPIDFWTWEPGKQLEWLQTRKQVLTDLESIAAAYKRINDAKNPQHAQGSAPPMPQQASASVVVQGGHLLTPESDLPVTKRIYRRDNVRVADLLLLPNNTLRTVRAGMTLGDITVTEITPDDVIVTINKQKVTLQGAKIVAAPGLSGRTAAPLIDVSQDTKSLAPLIAPPPGIVRTPDSPQIMGGRAN